MIDFNNALANALLDRIDIEFPAGSLLELRSGAAPGADNAATGTLLCTITLPAAPWVAAALGVKARQNAWSDVGTAAAGAGTNVAHFRLKNAAGTKIVEGTVTATGGGGDATIDNVSVATGQAVNVTSFNFTS